MIDFSTKHDVMILNPDGTLQPMDEPYFAAEKAAPETWKITSDGDYSYLVAGDREALLIDTGYGSGDIREYAQTLTDVPLRAAANTHDHFDHTAGNGYFEVVYMSEKTLPLATIPYPSFSGITFPKAKSVKIVGDGDVIDLGQRKLEVIFMPDHAVGSILFLDRKERILFAGDEIGQFKRINGTIEKVFGQFKKLSEVRAAFDVICAGPGVFGAEIVDQIMDGLGLILSQAPERDVLETINKDGELLRMPFPGIVPPAAVFRPPVIPGYEGMTIYERRGARPEDLPADFDKADPYKRIFCHKDVSIQYDIRRIYEQSR